jgi:hypothetical protein
MESFGFPQPLETRRCRCALKARRKIARGQGAQRPQPREKRASPIPAP